MRTETSIQATIDDLNQYLQGNVTSEGLIDTLQDMINFLKDSEGISENKEFNLKKYLKDNPLLNEVEEEEDIEVRYDGKPWQDFDSEVDDLMTQAEIGIDELLVDLRGQAYDLGGEFNGPGIWHDIKKLIREKI